jgi:hypothetical protein
MQETDQLKQQIELIEPNFKEDDLKLMREEIYQMRKFIESSKQSKEKN